MRPRIQIDEPKLVERCLSMEQDGWNEFYRSYVGLVRTVVKRRLGTDPDCVAEITQEVFVALMKDLHGYDASYQLSRFVSLIANRVCIDAHRAREAGKRHAQTEPVDHHDGGEEGLTIVCSPLRLQDEQVSDSELAALLRSALRAISSRCREILTLRYFKEMPFREIAAIIGGTEHAITVEAGRCLNRLRDRYRELERKGVRPHEAGYMYPDETPS